MRVSNLLLRSWPFVAALTIHAQDATVRVNVGPLNPPTPLSRAAATPLSSAALNDILASAQRAQAIGLPSVAVPLYRSLLDASVADREEITLALATALLDAGNGAEAQKVLAALPTAPSAAWHLRAGLAALQLRKRDDAQAEWNAIKADDVALPDRPWYYYLTGVLYDTAAVRDTTRANEFYLKAEASASTELTRARFKLAEEQVRLRMIGAPTNEALQQTLRNFEQFQGRAPSYDFAKTYAIELAMLNRSGEAVEFLQRRVLLTLPPQERTWRDEFNFVLGTIGDAKRTGPARNALNQLLETGANIDRQRQALQLLATASEQEPGRGQFRAELTKLIAASPAHPIKESLLFYRGQLALAEKNYAQAEDDANALLTNYPGSPLRMHAFGLLTSSAWEQGRFRLAANNARRARAELATAVDPALIEARARLGVLEAEAWFRAGDVDDYRNAADAYAAALRERPAGVPPGDLMFQRVLAEIKSGSPNAAKVLDEIETDPAFDVENRWQAEWNLARELQTRGKDGVAEAYARVNRLLAASAGDSAAIKPELRARMAWMQARLSYETEEFERTLTLVDGLGKFGGEIDAGMKIEIEGSARLLRAQAQLKLGKEADALKALQQLQDDPKFAKTDAAVSSYLVQADHYERHDQIAKAQQCLTGLADKFSDSVYAAYALYQAALLAERLGQEDNFREANRLLVDLVKKYPASDLVFAAQLKEGDILEKLNQYPQAQQVYEVLENNFPRHRDVVRAQLALARCLDAQASGNPSYLPIAQAKYEQLLDRVDAPSDLRVEAGYRLGELLARRDNLDRALEVWWSDVIHPFLLGDNPARKAKLIELDGASGVNGRYWMARTLTRTGDLLEQKGNVEDAKRAWLLLLEKKLGGDSLARAKLARYGVPETKP